MAKTSLIICSPNRIRTYDLLLRRQLLYPAELWNQNIFCFFQSECKDNILFNIMSYCYVFYF